MSKPMVRSYAGHRNREPCHGEWKAAVLPLLLCVLLQPLRAPPPPAPWAAAALVLLRPNALRLALPLRRCDARGGAAAFAAVVTVQMLLHPTHPPVRRCAPRRRACGAAVAAPTSSSSPRSPRPRCVHSAARLLRVLVHP